MTHEKNLKNQLKDTDRKLSDYLRLNKAYISQQNFLRDGKNLKDSILTVLPCTVLALAPNIGHSAVTTRVVNQTVANGNVGIDIDNNGSAEMVLKVNLGSIKIDTLAAGIGVVGTTTSVYNSFNSSYSFFTHPSKLGVGAVIQNPMENPINHATLTKGSGTNGEWINDGTPGYLGVRFKIGANDHFGWVELVVTDASPGPNQVVIRRVGYETTPNTPTTTPAFLPVELISFSSEVFQENIRLNWQTASETNNAGFEVQRSTDGENFKDLTFIEGNGTSFERQEYFFDDKALRSSQLYYYRLKQIDYDGQFEYSKVITAQIEGEGISASFSPNPSADGQSRLDYIAGSEGTLNLRIFNVAGKELLHQTLEVSEGANQFDMDFSGFGQGMFFVKMEQAGRSAYQKLILK